MVIALGATTLALAAQGCLANPDDTGARQPLVLERTVPLTGVRGRIDHLAVDTARGRLFVAERGNGSVEAIDIATGRSLGRISGLSEPQGLGYMPERGELAVATGGDGMLRFYRATDLAPVGSIKLGGDADNVRIDRTTGHVVVGYGVGALAVVDPATRQVVSTAPMSAHPEGFQLEGGWAYVNVPDAGQIAVLDLKSGKRLAAWPNGWLKFNYSLALDPPAATLAAVYRFPATLAIYDIGTGARRQALGTCGDADDVFFDHERKRLYVICGTGAVDVFGANGKTYARLDRIRTRSGARTGFFVPQLDRLFVAARAGASDPAAILVYRPTP